MAILIVLMLSAIVTAMSLLWYSNEGSEVSHVAASYVSLTLAVIVICMFSSAITVALLSYRP